MLQRVMHIVVKGLGMVYSTLCNLQQVSVVEIEVLKTCQILNNIRGRKHSFSLISGRL